MSRRPPRYTRTYTILTHTTLFRSRGRGPAAGAEATAQDDRRPRAGLRQGGQDRAYPPDGRDADDLRPGARCLVVPAGLGAGADRGCTEAPAAAADRRYLDRHRNQRRPEFRQGEGEDTLDPVADEVRIGGRPVGRHGLAGRHGGEAWWGKGCRDG